MRCRCHATMVKQGVGGRVGGNSGERVGGRERVGKPLLRLLEVVADLVEQWRFASHLFERVGDILFECSVIGNEIHVLSVSD